MIAFRLAGALAAALFLAGEVLAGAPRDVSEELVEGRSR